MVKNFNQKQYYIPMETTVDFAKANGFTSEDFVWQKIGNRSKRVILIPCTQEEYYAYMRPLWKEMKREERQKKYFEEKDMQVVSIENIQDNFDLEIIDSKTTNEEREKQLLLDELKYLLNQLEELDKQIMTLYLEGYSESEIGKEIGMSQKGVNKRKHNVIKKLKLHFSK